MKVFINGIDVSIRQMSPQEDSEWCSPLLLKLNAYVVGLWYSVFIVLSPVWGVKGYLEIPSGISDSPW